MEPGNTCRPSDLLAALFPETPEASWWTACRKECLHSATGGTLEPITEAASFLLVRE
jgi:hypothetical protein